MSGEEPITQIAPVESPQMVSTVKLPILKKGEYTLWSMRMKQYLTNTYYSLWQVSLNGDGPIQVTTDEKGIEMEVPPKTAQALLQRQRERKVKSILLLAIPDEYQRRFHGIKDAKSMWAAIKKGLDKAYDRFQKLISLLEVHGAAVPNEDANQKFLRALPSSWNNVALIMRNKDGIDNLDIDDLYNNLKVFEADIKGSSGSSLNFQNVAFLSAEDTSSSNEFNTANGPNSPQLDDEDLKQIDHDDLEEIDLKWECRAPRNQGNKNGDAGYRSRDNTKRTVPVETSDALVVHGNALIVQDGLGYDRSYIAQDEPTEFALMAYTSNSSGSDTEVQSCFKKCVKTYEKLQKQFDEQRQTLSKANLEIIAYQLGLESIEAQLVVHQKNEAVYEEKIAVLEFEVKDKSNAITRLKNQLDETLREKDDLKAKLEQFETSSKNLNKLINSQISSKDKTGLGYGDQLNENDSSGSELFNSVFDSRSSDGDDNQTNDRFKKDNGYHDVPPLVTRNYMPPLADLSFAGFDDSVYRPTANKTSASVSQVETSITPPSNTSVEMPRVESVRPSGVIIEDWVSDDDEDIFQSNDLQATDKPSFKKIEFTNARNESVKPKQAEKPRITTQNPKVDKRYWNGKMTQKLGLGFGFTKKACFVCGGYSHLIKDCDFHDKRMAKKSVLRNIGKNTGQKEIRPVWNSAQKINHQNKFVPSAVLTRQTAVSAVKGNGVTTVKASAGCVWRPKMTDLNSVSKNNSGSWVSKRGNPQQALKNKGIFDSGCSRHMTGNKDFLTYYQDIDAGFVAFGGGTREGMDKSKITRKQSKQEKHGRENQKKYKAEAPKPKSCFTAGNQTNKNAGPQEANGDTGLKKSVDARQSEEKNVSTQQYIVFPLWSSISSSYKSSDETYKNDTADDAADETPVQKPASENEQALKNVLDKMMDQEKEASEKSDVVRKEFEAQCNRELLQGKATKASSTNSFNTVSTPVNAASAPRTSNDAGPSFVPLGGSFPLNVNDLPDDPLMPDLEDTAEVQNTGIFGSAFDDEDLDTYNSPFADQVMGAEADFNNMEPSTVHLKVKVQQHLLNPNPHPLPHNQIFHEPRTEAHIEQLLPSPTTYQRKRKTQIRRKTTKDTKLPQTSVPQDLGADKAIHKEGVTVWKGPSLLWQSQAPRNHGGTPAQTRSERVLKKPNEPPLSEGHTSGSGKGRMEHQFELTANVPITPHDSPLPGGYTPGSDEGRLKLQELMTMCIKLSKHVLNLEKEKDAQTFEPSDDDLDEENASKQGMGSDKIKPILCNFTLCLWMLEAKEESTMAFELIKFIKSMLEE
ncbi:hypothetical protein Tco_1204194 [Tanacetum coccineum]